MKKTAYTITAFAFLFGAIAVLAKLGLLGAGFELPIVTRMILGIFFLVIGLGLASFLMGVYLKIYDLPEAIEVKLSILLGMNLILILSAGALLFLI